MTSAVAQAEVAVFALPRGAHDAPRGRWPQRGRDRLQLRQVREDDERRDEQDAAAHAEQPARHPGGEAEREQAGEVEGVHQNTSAAAEAEQEHHERARHGALGDPLLDGGAGEHAGDRGAATSRPLARSTLP